MQHVNMSPISAGHGLSGLTEPFLPNQHYVSLFKPSAEVPRFNFPNSYWEGEARLILMGYDIHEIQRLIRYGFFSDNLPRDVLRSRNKGTVDGFFEIVAPQIVELSQDKQVEEIIRRSKVASVPLLPWGWFPSLQDLPAKTIAEAIEAESHRQFTRIPFEEWVRYSLGYSVFSIECFLHQHTNLHKLLLDHLLDFPDEIEKYSKIEEIRRKRSVSSSRLINFRIASSKAEPIHSSGCRAMLVEAYVYSQL